jgi:hypothetical protein
MTAYQKKVKSLLKTMEDEAADEAEKHLNKARHAMESWLKEVSKNLPAGSEKFSDVVKDIADAGHKVLKEGRKMAKQAAEAAEHGAHSLGEMMKEKPVAKKATAKKPTARKTVAKKATRARR